MKGSKSETGSRLANNEYTAAFGSNRTRAAELVAASGYKSLKQRVNENFPGATYTVEGTYPTDTITIEAPPLFTPEESKNLDQLIREAKAREKYLVVYMWSTTIDEKTCPFCVSLHGRIWTMDQADLIPNIPDDTHYNCRCRVMLVESDFAAQIAEEQATTNNNIV